MVLGFFIRELENSVLSKLNGTHPSFERYVCPDKPSKEVIIGTLSDCSKDFGENSEEERRTLTAVKNNSMSVSFLLPSNSLRATLKIKPCASVFYRIRPHYNEQISNLSEIDKSENSINLVQVWKRKKCAFNPLNFELDSSGEEYTLSFEKDIKEISDDCDLWKGEATQSVSRECLSNEIKYNEEVNQLQRGKIAPLEWSSGVVIEKRPFIQKNQTLDFITVSLINNTEQNNKYETFLFDCNLLIDINGAKLIPFNYEYEVDEEFKEYESFLRTINCHAEYNQNLDCIATKHYAVYEQNKINPKTNAKDLTFTFEKLKNTKLNIDLLKQLVSCMEEYLSDKEGSSHINTKNKDSFRNTVNRVNEGIALLESNPDALKAFEMMQETFEKAQGQKYSGWRVFQIVFILSLITDIVDKSLRRDVVEVLHVSTGGGKSESYFGLVLFSAFYDRLTYKNFGITAITKFPLRMLSIQQLQRIVNLFAWANRIKKEHSIGGDDFSIAYFVGTSEEFPRYTKEVIDKIKMSQNNPGRILKRCPFCKGDVCLDYNKIQRFIFHRCQKCNETFRIYFTDEEIYRFLPTFIVSTVDKFAGVAQNRRFKNILGGKLDQCKNGHGFIPKGDQCEVEIDKKKCDAGGTPLKITFSTAPSLVIQDEMHLIKESFGTINSHFETLMDAMQNDFCGYVPKRIAMTATIRGAPSQIKELYNINTTAIFPGGPIDNDINDFYFEYDRDKHGEKTLQRKLIGLKPNLRDNQYATLLTLRYIAEYIKEVEENSPQICDNLKIDPDDLKKVIHFYEVILTYHHKKSDVHTMKFYTEAVTNSKLSKFNLLTKVLTGENTLGEISSIISEIEEFHSGFGEDTYKNLYAVYANSVVSHGVDIDRWNLMAFQGMPNSTAEYIQALSRVGRKYPALAFMWFYPNRARDLSFYKNFNEYHGILEHKVEQVPISRWAKLGLNQTFTSIFSAAILNYYSNLLEKPLYKVDDVNDVFESPRNRQLLADFVTKAYGADKEDIGAKEYKNRIGSEVDRRLNYLQKYRGLNKNFFPNALKESPDKEFRTQYGMRGIQDTIILDPSILDIEFIRKSLGGR